jgi:glutamate-1-semialdehyde 2,1-aminomutase
MANTKVLPSDIVAAYAEANPKSRAAHERASRVLPGGVTHEVRSFVPFLPYITKASGAHKWDLDGHEYIDYAIGHGALILGHAHPAIVEAVTRQVALGTHPGANHLGEVEWAERVQRLVPGAELVRFTNSGTEATLLAIRLARAATGRPKIIKFQGHFHGWHDAVTPAQAPPWDAMPPGISSSVARDTVVLPPDVSAVESALASDQEIGAVIVEASGASWGTAPLPLGFLPDLRTLTRSREILMIMDEVITGFRWAPGGVQQAAGVQADLVTLAKILAGGLPGGAVAGRRDLLEPIALPDGGDSAAGQGSAGGRGAALRRRITHPGTFNANPLSAAAGIACLDLVKDPSLQERCGRLAADLRAGLNQVLARRGIHGAVYGESSVFHLAIDDRITPGDPSSIAALSTEERKQQRRQPLVAGLTLAMFLDGVHLFAMGGFLSTAHTADDIARTVDAFDGTMHRLSDSIT